MSETVAVPPPASSWSGRVLGSLNIFIDPAGAARSVPQAWSWVVPVLLSGAVIGTCSFLQIPTVLRIMQVNPPGNMTPEQIQKSLPVIEMTQKVTAALSPVIAGVMVLIFAGLLTAACAVLDIKAKFRDNFSLLAHGGLIGAVGFLAGFLVVRLKGDDVQSMLELRPAFGLDLLLAEGANKYLHAVLNYFSLFTIWYLIMLTLTLSIMARISKGKAFAALTPVWVVGLIFVLIGAVFSR